MHPIHRHPAKATAFAANEERRRELGVSDELAAIEGITSAMMVVLGENEVRSLDDLGDLASDELIEMLGDLAPDAESANAIIMAARAHWFEDEEVAAEPEVAVEEAAAPQAASEEAVEG